MRRGLDVPDDGDHLKLDLVSFLKRPNSELRLLCRITNNRFANGDLVLRSSVEVTVVSNGLRPLRDGSYETRFVLPEGAGIANIANLIVEGRFEQVANATERFEYGLDLSAYFSINGVEKFASFKVPAMVSSSFFAADSETSATVMGTTRKVCMKSEQSGGNFMCHVRTCSDDGSESSCSAWIPIRGSEGCDRTGTC